MQLFGQDGRRRHVRVSDTEIEHVFRADLSGAFGGISRDHADEVFLLAVQQRKLWQSGHRSFLQTESSFAVRQSCWESSCRFRRFFRSLNCTLSIIAVKIDSKRSRKRICGKSVKAVTSACRHIGSCSGTWPERIYLLTIPRNSMKVNGSLTIKSDKNQSKGDGISVSLDDHAASGRYFPTRERKSTARASFARSGSTKGRTHFASAAAHEIGPAVFT